LCNKYSFTKSAHRVFPDFKLKLLHTFGIAVIKVSATLAGKEASMVYEKVPTDLKFVEREREVEKFWKDNDIFQKSIDSRKEGETYTFYDGPPTANGKPHIGHVLTRVIKDMIPRYRTMKGYMVPRKAGWDTHGLPVELEVEKKLGLDGKEQIEEYGLEPFIRHCKESVWKYKGMWEDFSSTVGFWADMDNPYVTYDNNFIESEWWALKQIWDKKLLYKGFKIVPYCPRCGTPLSSHEVAQGYKSVKERSAVVRFKVTGEDAYFLAWTTTPWTLPSNVALCVNPDETYVKVKAADGYTYYMAEALLDKVLAGLAVKTGQTVDGKELATDEDGKVAENISGEGVDYTVLEKFTGKALEYKEYEPLFACAGEAAAKQHKKGHFVTCDTYVTMSDGTGIVHIAPAFGEDDAKVGRKYDLPFVQFVDGKGELTEETPYAGLFVKKADPEVLKDLDKEGKLFDAPKFEHDYPFCWRCDTPLIYYARESWFIKMTDPEVKANLIANNKKINWIPETIGTGRFGAWLENVQDWGISRNRYWGTPLNIWQCEDCGEMMSIGSIAELKEKSDNCPDNIELHRPYIDAVTCKCGKCGGTMKRVPEVIDCWFDSGSMPFAQHHYPFENKDIFEQQFPAKFISEAVDQTRGWFYSLLAISTLLFNKAPYENVIVLGHVQDADGQKMSKSKGNAVDPMEALNKHGADAIRWYFYENSAPWLPNRFHDKAVTEGQRKFMGTIWNTYAFFVLYANIDDFDATKYTLEYDKLPVMDKWILSKLNTVVKTVDDNLNNYKITETARTLEDFVDELSNWYVRRCRERFWAKGMEQDKINAYMTLYTTLVTLCKTAAPMIPFMTESIYRNLVCSIDKSAPISVHLCDFPKVQEDWIDKELEDNMEDVLNAVVIGRACRNATNIKNRQPIGRMFIKAPWKLNEFFTDIIADELNVKSVEYKDDVRDFTSYTFKPQLKTLGPKYGKFLGEIRKQLTELDGNKAMDELNNAGFITLQVNGQDIRLEKADLLIEMTQMEGYVANSDKGITVVMDTNLTPELIEEGFVREIVSKIQTMRKDAGFEVMDRIKVYVSGNDRIADLMQRNAEQVKSVVLADDIIASEAEGFVKEWNINGENVTLGVEKN
jgi:isoleucyl-tRNA synthetase